MLVRYSVQSYAIAYKLYTIVYKAKSLYGTLVHYSVQEKLLYGTLYAMGLYAIAYRTLVYSVRYFPYTTPAWVGGFIYASVPELFRILGKPQRHIVSCGGQQECTLQVG